MDSTREHVAVITGGGSGIGFAIAKEFIAQGVKVILFGRSSKRLSQAMDALGDGAFAVPGDVTDENDIDKLYYIVRQHHGYVDTVVACAGVADGCAFEAIDKAHYDDVMGTNVYGVVNTLTGAVPLMRDRGGSVVLVGSIAKRQAIPGGALYSASKACISALARNLTVELAPLRIRINELCPGYVDTGLAEKLGLTDVQLNTLRKSIKDTVPLGRYINANEIAKAAWFLANPESASINGASIDVHGGLNSLQVANFD